MKIIIAILALFFLLFIPYTANAQDPQPAIVIIVNSSNALNNISSGSLARIYKGRQQKWPNGERIVVVNRPVRSKIRQRFYSNVLDSPPTKKFFEPGSPIPFRSIEIRSDKAVVAFVKRVPNSISYVYRQSAGQGIRVLLVDGQNADENNYLLGELAAAENSSSSQK